MPGKCCLFALALIVAMLTLGYQESWAQTDEADIGSADDSKLPKNPPLPGAKADKKKKGFAAPGNLNPKKGKSGKKGSPAIKSIGVPPSVSPAAQKSGSNLLKKGGVMGRDQMLRGKKQQNDKNGDDKSPPTPPPVSSGVRGGLKLPARTAPTLPTSTATKQETGPAQMGGVEEERKDFKEFQKGEKYYIDYYEQDLIEFVKQMSEKFKVNFILSDKVKGGKITIISPNPVSREEAWQAFLSALESKKYTLVRVGKFYKIIPFKEAQRSPIRTYLEGGSTDPSDEAITYVLKLKHIEIKDISKILKDIRGKEGNIIEFEPTNSMIITDAAINIRRMVKIVNELDLPGGRDAIHVIDIYYAGAEDIADKLNQIFGEKGGGQKKKKTTSRRKGKKGTAQSDSESSATVTLSNVIADERTNQLIIVAPRDAMPRILDMINRLDVPIPGDGQVHVFYLENANAEELASTLTGFAGKGKSSKSKKKGGSSGELFEGEVKITADKATNSLVIVASVKDYTQLKKVIKKLDIPRRQVFVEAVIMEVTLTKNDTMGIALAGGYSLDIGGETVPIYGATTLGAMSPLALDPTTLSGMAVGLTGPELDGTEGILGEGITFPSFGVILQMIQTDSDANVLSTPHILTMDNEEAEIIVGSNVPFITGSARDSNNQPVLSIQRQDVALTLKIKPQINESDFIRLEVQQEITELASISETLGPTTTKRSAKSTVVVKDDNTIVIGGLISDRQTSDSEKVPLLGDLPILGRLFRRDKDTNQKTNLLIFLTPHIIKDENDFQKIFKRKMEDRNEFLRRFYGTDDTYEFDIDYSSKTGALENIRTAYEEQRKQQKIKELEEQEVIIAPETGHTAFEIGVTDAGGGTSSSTQGSGESGDYEGFSGSSSSSGSSISGSGDHSESSSGKSRKSSRKKKERSHKEIMKQMLKSRERALEGSGDNE